MELIVLPQALMIFYGAVVLACGGGLGYILGRNVRRRIGAGPESPDTLDKRLGLVEDELGLAQSEILALREERDFLRRLGQESVPAKRTPEQHVA